MFVLQVWEAATKVVKEEEAINLSWLFDSINLI
jgi:hypothetical protein